MLTESNKSNDSRLEEETQRHRNNRTVERCQQNGQTYKVIWLWLLSWQKGRFQHQRTRVWILSSAIFSKKARIAQWYLIQLWTSVHLAAPLGVRSCLGMMILYRTLAHHLYFFHDFIWLILFVHWICPWFAKHKIENKRNCGWRWQKF